MNHRRRISRKLNCRKGWRHTPFSLTSCFLATLKTRASSITAKSLSTRLSVIIHFTLEAFLVPGLTSTNFFPRKKHKYIYPRLFGFTLALSLPAAKSCKISASYFRPFRRYELVNFKNGGYQRVMPWKL